MVRVKVVDKDNEEEDIDVDIQGLSVNDNYFDKKEENMNNIIC